MKELRFPLQRPSPCANVSDREAGESFLVPKHLACGRICAAAEVAPRVFHFFSGVAPGEVKKITQLVH